MGIRTILIDDETRGLSTLQKLLEVYCQELRVVAACENAAVAKEKIELLEPQLVFLDISMPGKNGFELLADLKDINFEIIFVTAHHEYMPQAFRYSAVDYLMKPIDEDQLIDAVQRATRRIAANSIDGNVSALLHNLTHTLKPQEMKICLPSQKGFQVVDLKDIIFCEASGSYTNFNFTQRHLICTSKPIYEYEEMLGDAGFVRIHKSYLVNMAHIKEYLRGEGGTVVLMNGKELEVSRRKKESFLISMKQFFKF